MNVKNYELKWLPLENCPDKQLEKDNPEKGHHTDAGYDLRIAQDVLVLPYQDLPFEWERVKLLKNPDGSKCWQADPPSSLLGYVQEGYVMRKKYKIPLVGTGVRLIHEDESTLSWVALMMRSSASKFGLYLGNTVGVVDWAYTGELKLALASHQSPVAIARGEAVCQMIAIPQFNLTLTKVTQDGRVFQRDGFGSTTDATVAGS